MRSSLHTWSARSAYPARFCVLRVLGMDGINRLVLFFLHAQFCRNDTAVVFQGVHLKVLLALTERIRVAHGYWMSEAGFL